MLPSVGSSVADVKLAEVGIAQNLLVGPTRLLEDLLAVSDEQETQPLAVCTLDEPLVIQGCNHGLARTCRGDDEVAMAIVHNPLYVEHVEHLLLIREGPHLEPRQRDRDAISTPAAARLSQRLVQAVAVSVRVVGLEVGG